MIEDMLLKNAHIRHVVKSLQMQPTDQEDAQAPTKTVIGGGGVRNAIRTLA